MVRILLCIFFLASSLLGTPLVRSDVLFDECGKPSYALLDVLKAFEVKHDGSWQSIIDATQKEWLRKPGSQRWEVEANTKVPPEKVYALFTPLLMTDSLRSSQLEYQYGVILGSSLAVMRDKIYFLKNEWESGVRFSTIVFLTGDRPLADFENDEALNKSPYPIRRNWITRSVPRTEGELIPILYDQMDLPEDLRAVPVVHINVPMKDNNERPNTKDTFVAWRSSCPLPGSIDIFSSQPFIGRQDAVARSVIPPTFTIETIGPGFTLERLQKEKRGAAILLDELARWIFEASLLNSSYAQKG